MISRNREQLEMQTTGAIEEDISFRPKPVEIALLHSAGATWQPARIVPLPKDLLASCGSISKKQLQQPAWLP